MVHYVTLYFAALFAASDQPHLTAIFCLSERPLALADALSSPETSSSTPVLGPLHAHLPPLCL